MPPINILIKPASSACNMACQYCFYKDVAAHREQEFEGMLSIESIEKVIQAGMEYAEHICSFAFQGGEPTLAGLDFYRQVVVLQKQYAKPGVEIRNAIQTNGYTIDEEWAAFFAENHFLVGLSLDGPPELHNRNRTDVQGKDTFNRVMKSVRLLEKHNVAFNILCVVTGQNARSVEKLYRFYRKQKFRWLQFIPCIDPFDRADGEPCYTLTADGYGDFLVRLFDLWFDDLRHGEYISIRHLDNWLSILLGERPEACNMAAARCSSLWRATAVCILVIFMCWMNGGWETSEKLVWLICRTARLQKDSFGSRLPYRRSARPVSGSACAATAAVVTEISCRTA